MVFGDEKLSELFFLFKLLHTLGFGFSVELVRLGLQVIQRRKGLLVFDEADFGLIRWAQVRIETRSSKFILC